MKEIKFRAWDGEQMGPVLYLRFDKPIVPPLVIMQFTGLHDKNGKDIYEGDILRYENWDPEYDTTSIEIGSIVWEKSTARFTSNIGGQFIPNSRSQIIGNIYENPELLGDN